MKVSEQELEALLELRNSFWLCNKLGFNVITTNNNLTVTRKETDLTFNTDESSKNINEILKWHSNNM